MKNNDEKRFWIGQDGFDAGVHFATYEEAAEYKAAHLSELLRHCTYQVTVYERDTPVVIKLS